MKFWGNIILNWITQKVVNMKVFKRYRKLFSGIGFRIILYKAHILRKFDNWS